MNIETTSTVKPTTYDTLFAVLRSTLWGEERFPFVVEEGTAPDWDMLCKEMSWHAIRILPTDLLCRADSTHRQRYMMHATFSVSAWYAVMEAQKGLCSLLKDAKIPFVILKGAASAHYYPQPTYRQMGDIDFLVPPKFFDQAHQLLLREGYKQLDEGTPRHLEFKKNNALFELHRVFAKHNDSAAEALLDDLLFDAFERLETATVEGYSFPVFPPLESGLILLQHINQHLEEGLGLRQILDWALYVDKSLDNDMWEQEFAPIVRRLGLEKLAICVTRMCQLYLGLRPDITWCAGAKSDVCQRLMDYIMEQGNFGRKGDTDSHKSVNTLSAMQNIPAFFKRLQERGLKHWPAVSKYPRLRPILVPFAWIWQFFRYIHLGLKREHPFKSLMQDVRKSRSKDELMEALGAYQFKREL